jgi:hypothetical protein
MEFMPEHAPLAVVAFLGTVLLLGTLALVSGVAIFTRRKWIGIVGTVLALAVTCGYWLVLAGVSLTSHERTLAPGENKYFCEIDCHIAYSVVNFEEIKALGNESDQIVATGRFVIVRLRTWFDPSTVSPNRGNGLLTPSPRRIFLVDDAGQRFSQSVAGGRALANLRGATTPLTQALRPGETFVTDLVFDVPRNIPVQGPNLRLFVGDNCAMPDRVLIGHEDSFLHPKIFLSLAPSTVLAGRVP